MRFHEMVILREYENGNIKREDRELINLRYVVSILPVGGSKLKFCMADNLPDYYGIYDNEEERDQEYRNLKYKLEGR